MYQEKGAPGFARADQPFQVLELEVGRQPEKRKLLEERTERRIGWYWGQVNSTRAEVGSDSGNASMWVAGMTASVEPLGGYLNRQPKVAVQDIQIEVNCERWQDQIFTNSISSSELNGFERWELEENDVPKVTMIQNWITGFSRKWKGAMAMHFLELK
ncbi:hypothetical protein C2G38_2181996 [Gigaspora rosea]|uniref:Uncharacterized protein n=1 Tax=Gigaspora rosea TaxID=44941 RepID=A0A397VC22_9GLOM|nr:hypothetical protein C2G38_2181996 [Gigaspora rosea]